MSDETEQDAQATEAMAEDGKNAEDTDWQAEAEKFRNEYLRSLADMENLRKRMEKQMDDARNYAVERFARELLPVVDSLEMALATPSGDDDAMVQFRQGIENTLHLFSGALSKAGVREVEVENGRFDPNLHQAIAMVEQDGEANRILAVHQKGYLIHDRLLRPSMVSVSKAAKSQ